MDGEIVQQRSSYRQGLVLGLTMAEIMLLLVFCLLIAMATFLRKEQKELAEAKQDLVQQRAENARDRAVVAAMEQNPGLMEKLRDLSGLTDPKEISKYWRELVESRAAIVDLEKTGLSINDLRDKVAILEKLRSSSIDPEKALHDAAVIASIDRAMTKPGDPPASSLAILDAIEHGMAKPGTGPSGHQWPPIITLSDAAGYSFKIGSAELSQKLHDELISSTPDKIFEYIKKYDVDVIEVVGHTDEQPISARPSNLDRDLPSVLNGVASVASLVPADNAGLGLARAVSVISVLRRSSLLTNYKLIPLSGAQLVNTDETLAVFGTPGDDPRRRRIEIRLRKSNPQDTTASASPAPPLILPKPRPTPRKPPLVLTPGPVPVPKPVARPSLTPAI